MKLSVIICTYNPRRDYLARVIDSLKKQTLSFGEWELIVVDNASPEPLAGWLDLSWHRNARSVVEPALGLTRARIKGAEVSGCEVICYLDDDTVVQDDYLEQALAIGDQWPILGAWGGQLLPEYEPGFSPSPEAARLWDLSLDRDVWSSLDDRSACPVGGGMIVRRRVLAHYQLALKNDPLRRDLDRKGDSLVSDGDIDLAFCACDLGLGIGRFRSLVITHLIPKSRCTEAYLDRLAQSIGYSSTLLSYLRGKPTHLTFPRKVLSYWHLITRGARWQFYWNQGVAKALEKMDGISREKKFSDG
ncbi:MAG TPA: glycosyltransferase family 2 protein [Chthoniobacteraceae bacterium]|nr:glycosyltransferase family 2 protein [Chthoniobacteraceae bacterium]